MNALTTRDGARPQGNDSVALERTVFLGLLASTFALSRCFFLFSNRVPDWEHLGGEYFNIAEALTQGRGFADPFGDRTGPTSWMAPLFSLLLAGLLVLFKTKTLVAQVVAGMTNVVFAMVGVVVFRVARRHVQFLSPFVAVALYVIWLCVFYNAYFMLTHDTWLVALATSLVVLSISTWVRDGVVKPHRWGGLGGLAILVNPALAAAWAVVSLLWFVKRPANRRALLVAGALAAALASPWMIRNAVVFHRFVPTKANMAYEAYLANNVDEDGVYDQTSFWQHPFNSLQVRKEYARLGEVDFVNRHGESFRSSVRRHPSRFLARVGHRVLATTLAYTSFEQAEELGPGRRLRPMLYAFPSLAALWLLVCRRNDALVSMLQVFYWFFLIPYWLIAFYGRHTSPLISVLVLWITLAIDQALSWAATISARPESAPPKR